MSVAWEIRGSFLSISVALNQILLQPLKEAPTHTSLNQHVPVSGKSLRARCATLRQRQIKQIFIPLLLHLLFPSRGEDLWPRSCLGMRSGASLALSPSWIEPFKRGQLPSGMRVKPSHPVILQALQASLAQCNT